MNTLTNKDKLALQVSLALVAGMFSFVPTVHAAPVLDKDVTGGATITTGTDTTITSTIDNNVINWADFSVGSGESVTFDGGEKSVANGAHNYLNVVTGNGTSYINGAMRGGNDVYLVNPQGVIMGESANIDVGNLYVSTQDSSNLKNIIDGKSKWDGTSSSVLSPSTVQAEVVNMGKITANSVYVEGTNIRFLNTADIVSADDGEVLKKVTLKSSSDGYVHVGYLTADPGEADYKDKNAGKANKASVLYGDTKIVDYMLVNNEDELKNINNNLSGNYMLADNIELPVEYTTTWGVKTPKSNFKPIGKDKSNAFKGKFDGNFFSIKNISIQFDDSVQYAGLFGCTDGARIENVKLVDVSITAALDEDNPKSQYGAGGIAGYANNTTFINVANSVSGTLDSFGEVSVVANAGTVSGLTVEGAAGGLVGWSAGTTSISNAYNEATIGDGSGLVGQVVEKGLKLNNSYNIGDMKYSTDDSNIKYYGLYGGEATASKITNSYNAGKFYYSSGSEDTSSHTIGPSGGTNCIDNATSKSQSDYPGLFSGTETANDTWRIYEGHSLPLLRSFLKANSHGTVALNYNVGLYAEENDTTPRAVIPGSAAKNLTYNGYYMGVAADDEGNVLSSNNARGLNSKKIGYNNTKVRDVTAENESGVNFFYSTGDQDGYDLADSSIKVVARNLLPVSGDVHITKVYDGTADASKAFGDALTLSKNAVDVADIYNNGGTVNGITYKAGTLVETGLVKVTKSDGTVVKTDAVTLDTSGLTANYASGANVVTNDKVNLIFPDDPDSMLTASSDTVHATDYKNYKFDTTPFDTKAITVIGDITQRPVQVSLTQATGIDKIYDGTLQVIDAVAPADAEKDNPEKHKYLTGNITEEKYNASDDKGRGIITDDLKKVEVAVNSAYYSTDGTAAKKTAQANDTANAYKAVYNLEFSGDSTKIKNYKFQDTSGNDLTDNVLTGTGTIAKRNVTLDNIAFLDKDGKEVDNKKTYDYTSAYTDATQVSFESDAVATEEEALAQTKVTGILKDDKGSFNFTLDTTTNSPKFYDSNTGTPKEAKTVSDAKYIKYTLATAGDADVLKNYTLNGEAITNGNVSVYREGEIEKRAISVAMLTDSGIDKTYDAKAAVVDGSNKGYLDFKGTGASGTTTTKGYVGYAGDTDHKLVVDDYGKTRNDGTAFSISAEYTTAAAVGAGTTTNAADVYVDDNKNAAAKKIKYTVSLTGDNAANYTLNGKDSNEVELEATGTINPRKITAIKFGDVSKKYDGTATVGEVNGVTQTQNQITITGVTIDNSDKQTLNKSGLLGDDTFDAVLGTENGVIPADSDASISGVYGTPGWDENKGTAFKADAHAYATNGSETGKERRVQYTGVKSLTSSNHNYTTDGMDDTQYGKGSINPLTINEITTDGTGNITKVYDGTPKVVGGYQMATTYDDDGNITIKPTLITSDDVKSKLGKITVKGEGVGGGTVSVDLSGSAYNVDTDNTHYDNEHVNDVGAIVYAVGFNANNGDYVLADKKEDIKNNSYTKDQSTGEAIIEKKNTGLITARVLKTSGVTGLTKTYDGTTKVVDANGNELKGDKVVKFEAKTEVTGLTGNDGVTNVSVAEYAGDLRDGYEAKDANLYTDGVQEDSSGAKKVKYTVKLSGTYADTDYEVFKDTNYDGKFASAKADGNSYTIEDAKYGGNIKQADLKISVDDIEKVYDSTAYVKGTHKNEANEDFDVTLTKGDAEAKYTFQGDDDIKFTTQDTSTFLANGDLGAEDVGTHQVQYDLVSTSTDLKNYRLLGNDLTFEKDGNIYTIKVKGSGKITQRDIDKIAAAIDEVTKVYDGNTSLIYNHTAELGYDDSQQKEVKEISSVKNITLGTLTITEGFSVDADNTNYEDANAKTGKKITYRLVVEKDALKNYEVNTDKINKSDASLNARMENGNLVFEYSTDNNTIEAKNVYAYLSDDGVAANPTKEYDGNIIILDKATSNGTTIDQSKANSFVTIDGLVSTDTKYKVTPTYASADAGLLDGKVTAKENVVNYLVDGLSDNYNLKVYDYDQEAKVITANKAIELEGLGTIEPKKLTLNVGLAEKVYDTESDIDLTDGTGVTSIPTFTVNPTDLVGTESITIATSGDNAIKGNYGIYDNGKFTADPNVAFVDNAVNFDASEVTFKAVQYENATKSFKAGNSSTKLTNYTLANGDAHIYDAENDTLTFTKDKEKGKITKLSVDKIEADIDTVTKVYDGNTSLTYDYTNDLSYDSTQRNKASAGDKVKNIKLGDVVTLDYGYTVDDKYTQFDSPDAGENNKDVTYRFNIEGKVIKNLELTGNQITTNDDGSYTFDQVKTGNTITPKNVYATLSDTGKEANPTKVYDGNTDVFNIAEDNGTTVTADKAKSYVTIKGLRDSDSDKYTVTKAEYQKKDVEVDDDALPVEGANKINYTVGVDSNNYKIKAGDITGTTNTDNTVKLVGKGTIDPRPLTLVAGIATKTYDMSETVNMTAKEAGDIAPEFKLENVLVGESVNFGEVTGEYGTYENKEFTADPNVALDDNNEATYKAVRYSKVRSYLSTNDPNTVLTNYTFADDDVHHAYDIVNDKLVFSAAKRKGLINKRDVESITPNFKDATKVYDGDNSLTYDHTDVDLHYDEKQNKDKHEAKDFVNSITLNTNGLGDVVVDKDSYSVEGNYETADVDTGKKVTYNLSIGKDFARNYDLHNLEGGSYKDGAFNFNEETNNNTITPKNIYASLTDEGEEADPTKEYDGTKEVFGKAMDGETVVDENKVKESYIDLPGFVDNDSYTVSAAYNNKNVKKARSIKYTIKDVSPNYKLYTKDSDGEVSESNSLMGGGTITPRGLTLSADLAQKTYDGNANVKFKITEDGDKVPTFSLPTGVEGEEIKLDSSIITGVYGTYTDADGFVADANVALDGNNKATYKAVQYSNVGKSLSAGNDQTDMSNYKLVNYKDAHLYNSATDELTFLAAKEKGLITKRKVNEIGMVIDENVDKVYDGETSLTYDHTAKELEYDDTQNKDKSNASDYVHGVTLTTDQQKNVDAVYSVAADYDTAKAGENKDITYKMTMGVDFARNYEMDSIKNGEYDSDGNFILTETTKGNTITAKNIYASLNDDGLAANPTKEYDGTTDVLNVTVDGGKVVDEAKAKSYVKVKGLVGDDKDKYKVDAVYNDKNVVVDDNGEVQTKAHKVTYTVDGIDDNYKLHDVDGNHNDKNTATLTGTGTITPREIKLESDLAQKTYDQNANVKLTNENLETGDSLPNLRVETGVKGESINTSVSSGVYGNIVDGTFNEDANVALDADRNAAYKAVKYSGVKLSEGNKDTDLKNYKLVDGEAVLTDGDWVFAADTQKGLITKRGIAAVDADIDPFSKVYDGTASLIYNHTASDYEDPNQVEQKAAITNINGVTLGNYAIEADDYSVEEANTKFDNAGVSIGDKAITYALRVNSDVISNYDVAEGLGNWNDDYSFTFTKETNKNSITPKNVYASLVDNLNPTKVYDGTITVIGAAKNNNEGDAIDQAAANSFVNLKGLLDGEDNITVTPTYQNKNVEVDDKGKAQAGKNAINYVISGVNGNYNLYTKDADGNISAKPNDTLVGDGTINQKEINLKVGYAEKAYDAKSDVNLVKTDTSADDDKYPTFTVSGEIAGEKLKVAISGDNAIKGNYGIYDDATGTFTADHNVDFDGDKVTYKAVQYSNVYGSLTGDKGYENTLATNYKFNLGNEKYNDDDDTLTFTVGQEKGKITQRIISGTETTWADSIVKEYDATSAIPDEDISKGFNIVGVSKVGDSEIKIPIAYTVTNAGFGSETEGIKDVGKNLPVFYRIKDISQEDLDRNFKLADDFHSISYKNYFENKDGIGEITQRIISGKATAALQEKIYDGNTSAEAGTTYFNIDQDDLDVLKKDGIADNVNVTGAYENKNANIDPNEVAKGGKVINYTMSWADGTADKNYIFADDNGTGEDYQGKGDIRRRKVYVVDKGGDVLTKTYDGTTALADGTNLSGRFGFEAADSEAQTGIIDSGVALKNADINGAYVSKDVARDDSGKVINKGVQFTGFGLEDINITDGNDDAGNYYLAVKDSTGTIPLSGNSEEKESTVNYAGEGDNIVITEVKGGRIEPKNITVSLKKSPTKVYDTDTLVKGGYVDEDGNTVAYASASNLEAAADGANVSRSFGNANNVIFDIDLGNGTKDTVEVAMDGTANYGDKNVSRNAKGKVMQDKVTSYNLSWNNSNYDLSGDFTADGTNGYTSEGSNKRTGVLQDKTGEITPYTISVKSMDSAKIYDGSNIAKNPDVTATFDDDAQAMINKDMAGSENISSDSLQEFVKLTVGKGEYGAPTEETVAAALEAGTATEAEIEDAADKDAAFNRTADPFQHHVSYSGMALGNGNYELDKDSFEDGTGIINRATVTAHGSSATIIADKDMPTFTGTLTGFVAGETMPVSVTETIKNEDGTTSTQTTIKQLPLAEYYNDAKHIYWGPDADVTGYSVGEHDVYGWYRIRRTELAYNEDGTPKVDDNGNQVYNYYWDLYKEANIDKNYTLTQDPGTFLVNPSYGGGGSSTPVSEPEPIPTTTPVSEPTAAPASEPATVAPVVDLGYVDKPVTPDSNVYQNVSKDSVDVSGHEANATIQYGSTGAGIAAENSSDSTIAIELSEVVNLLGGDVASDGTVSLSNTDGNSEFTVGSTEEGYLSVGTNSKDGSIGIETEDGSLYQGTAGKEGSIGIETEDGLSVESEDKEGSIGIETEDGLLVESEGKEGSISLETEDGTLLASDDGDDKSDEDTISTRKSSISLKSDENDISGDDRLVALEKGEKDEEDEDEEKEDEEKSEGKEGQADITYSDVA